MGIRAAVYAWAHERESLHSILMLAKLLATEGVEESFELRSRVGLMAFHGGSLEVMTDVIAQEAAERAGASVYAIRQPWGMRWHIPSNAMDPAHSPALQSFVEHVDVAIALHGWGTFDWTAAKNNGDPFRFGSDGRDRPILLGGPNREVAATIADEIRAALPGYEVVDDIEEIPPHIRGLDPRNLVNRAGRGVQVELPPRVRGLPPWWTKEQRGRACPDTQSLIAGLAAGVAALS